MHDIRPEDKDAIGGIIDEIETYASSKNVVVYYLRVEDLDRLGY